MVGKVYIKAKWPIVASGYLRPRLHGSGKIFCTDEFCSWTACLHASVQILLQWCLHRSVQSLDQSRNTG